MSYIYIHSDGYSVTQQSIMAKLGIMEACIYVGQITSLKRLNLEGGETSIYAQEIVDQNFDN
jgi:hypothetical protein